MRLGDLERLLAPIPPHPAPRADLEQYATPADLAAPLLFEAWRRGEIQGKRVVDLGCGTGVFALGAAILGAHATGVDVDAASLALARGEAERLGLDVDWVESEISAWRGEADTIVMNPPFGAQVRGADRAFLDAAFATAPVVYTLHHAPTRDFVLAYAERAGFASTQQWRLLFPLRHQFRHQSKRLQEVEVLAFRFEKTPSRL